MILCSYDNNEILVEPIQDRKHINLQQVFLKSHKKNCQKGYKPNIARLYNEMSENCFQIINIQSFNVKLVPLHNHWKNLT